MDTSVQLDHQVRVALAMFSDGIPEEERRCGWDEWSRAAFQKLFQRMLEDLATGSPLDTAANMGIPRGLDSLGISRGAWYEQTRLVVGLIRSLS